MKSIPPWPWFLAYAPSFFHSFEPYFSRTSATFASSKNFEKWSVTLSQNAMRRGYVRTMPREPCSRFMRV